MTRISNGSAMMTSSFIEGDLKWKLSALDVAKHWKFHVILRVDAIFNALCAVVDFHLWEDGSFLYQMMIVMLFIRKKRELILRALIRLGNRKNLVYGSDFCTMPFLFL